jgi:type I restriction enzyme S subunit
MACEWTVRPLEDFVATLIDYRGKTPQKISPGILLITAKIVKGGRIET